MTIGMAGIDNDPNIGLRQVPDEPGTHQSGSSGDQNGLHIPSTISAEKRSTGSGFIFPMNRPDYPLVITVAD
jgi:hypothetical protein